MTAARLEAMRAGRERQLAEQAQQHRDQVAEYLVWLKRESAAFMRMKQIRSILGHDDPMAIEARSAWRELWSNCPRTPPDSSEAWS